MDIFSSSSDESYNELYKHAYKMTSLLLVVNNKIEQKMLAVGGGAYLVRIWANT
jgi:hypothetical protein